MFNCVKPKILHITTSLGDGGAEAVLYRLCKSTQNEFSHQIVSLTGEGKYSEKLRNIGIKVVCLDFRSFQGVLVGCFRLLSLIRNLRPDAVQTWMYHADLFGGVIAKVAGCKNIFWGVHNTTLPEKSLTNYVVRILSSLSKFIPTKIVCCAESTKTLHVRLGYPLAKMVIIENGIDPNVFYCARQKSERNLVTIGMVARYADQKDHETLFKVIRKLCLMNFSFQCILAGSGVLSLKSKAVEIGIDHVIQFLGAVEDIESVYRQLDILVLTSKYGEACPNVLLEGMASGLFCVSTDIGDCKRIIDKYGFVCKVGDVDELAEKILLVSSWLTDDHVQKLRREEFQYIQEKYSLSVMTKKYSTLWLNRIGQ